MTRKEEIEKAAMQVAGVHPNWSNLDCFRMGFREGAKYADKTMLDRACSVFSDILIEICPELLGYGAGAKAWENKFRKRLEGGADDVR